MSHAQAAAQANMTWLVRVELDAMGVTISESRAWLIVQQIGPVVQEFDRICQDLAMDDDMFEFRRLLAEGGRNA